MQSYLNEKKNPKSKQIKAQKTQSLASAEVKTKGQLSGRFKLSTWKRKPRAKVVRGGERGKERDEEGGGEAVEVDEIVSVAGVRWEIDGVVRVVDGCIVAGQGADEPV